ncbi:MAG: hypothetical protein ACXQTR_06365 [Candidatus Methanospirareceae archaeon]|jgi:hypothetical protein
MDLTEIEKRLTDLDENLHFILKIIREENTPGEDEIESLTGAWGYDVDSVEFVRDLRRSRKSVQL